MRRDGGPTCSYDAPLLIPPNSPHNRELRHWHNGIRLIALLMTARTANQATTHLMPDMATTQNTIMNGKMQCPCIIVCFRLFSSIPLLTTTWVDVCVCVALLLLRTPSTDTSIECVLYMCQIVCNVCDIVIVIILCARLRHHRQERHNHITFTKSNMNV